MVNKVSPFSPDIGLTDIDRYDTPLPGLPAQREAQLTGEQVRQQVDELFRGTSVDDIIRSLATPNLSNPALLVPARFEARLRESIMYLKQLRSKAKSSGDPKLQRLEELLEHELNLRQLLSNYRNAC